MPGKANAISAETRRIYPRPLELDAPLPFKPLPFKTRARYLPVYDPATLAIASGGPAANNLAAPVSALGPQIDHPVRRLDDFQIVLDDHNRSPCFNETAKCRQEFADVIKMQPGRGLVKDVKQPPSELFARSNAPLLASPAANAPPASCAVPLHPKASSPTGLVASTPTRLLPETAICR